MTSFLDTACAAARERVIEASRHRPVEQLRDEVAGLGARSLAAALGGPDVAVIAEVKRASPSRGHIAVIPDAAQLARAYVTGGAAAVSVLTEPAWFKGSLHDLSSVAGAVDVPVLRKDFVVDAYQVWESAASGADAVLLIVAALQQDHLGVLLSTCHEAGIEALVETHDEDEVGRAVDAHEATGRDGPLVLGVNARDLTTLEVHPERFAALRGLLPDWAVAVAESGVRGPADVERHAARGVDAVLVGELVAGADEPTRAVEELVAAGRRAARAR